ncbi:MULTISPECIES: sigma-70 family RNA polymerase sigma factor [Streptomyces]|uniref:Sigma-70 family RNA polymerase sigma factor n=1 Tax=Streptomyces chartreusis TaxID=1969 RepID=A0A7H8T0G0_STRCX|nr:MULTISPECIES: sigma-70 family RNA polymerase sigma factor [Streptomyces]MBT1090150.1 sigma-70 family RNA polymerase sigma factor [Streptomyces sp. Tu102]QEV65993.1 sigma-70 family RNA polymerase sigma factor [Streptomyces chartreusis]QKZ16921.1 sigma-70 family RNA polymerase sigma factor [Streptomyces chartreusis]RSO07668.1 RNA polymerase subunit sigma-24 [Streptomyces sp. WAC 05379]GGW97162.1 hypothetical protein GCM10010321_08840 [Streptomyces chartreusis]
METHLVEAGPGRKGAVGTAAPAMVVPDDATSVFMQARPGLFKIAHRIVGDTDEAEDVIQEAWLRWQRADRTVVRNPSALLRTTTARLAINLVQSAWKRRESCASPWLPESTDLDATPEAVAERHDVAEGAVRLLMQTLTPRQRAVYVLREGFDYPYGRIAELLGIGVDNTRQQASRAQERLAADRPRQPVDSVAHRRLVQAFLAAAQYGDLAHLEAVLSTDAHA